MRHPLFLCMLVSVLFASSCGNDKPNPNEPENPDNPSGKIELWNKDKVIRDEYKSDFYSSYEAYTYDTQGREIAYTHYMNNELYEERRNYSYNGFVCTYDSYMKGDSRSNTTIEFYDESWNRGKIRNFTTTFRSGESATNKYKYDDQNRLIGVQSYDKSTLLSEYKNYQYSKDRISYDYLIYGSPPSNMTSITEYTYNDTKTIKKTYSANNPSSYQEWCYDHEGREIESVQYIDGKLFSENTNYIYKNKVCTYDSYSYGSSGTSIAKILIEYY